MSGGYGGNPFGGYGVVRAREPKISESADVKADQAALDEEELQELEAQLYGTGAGPRAARPVDSDAPDLETTDVEPADVEPVLAHHPRRPHLRKRG